GHHDAPSTAPSPCACDAPARRRRGGGRARARGRSGRRRVVDGDRFAVQGRALMHAGAAGPREQGHLLRAAGAERPLLLQRPLRRAAGPGALAVGLRDRAGARGRQRAARHARRRAALHPRPWSARAARGRRGARRAAAAARPGADALLQGRLRPRRAGSERGGPRSVRRAVVAHGGRAAVVEADLRLVAARRAAVRRAGCPGADRGPVRLRRPLARRRGGAGAARQRPAGRLRARRAPGAPGRAAAAGRHDRPAGHLRRDVSDVPRGPARRRRSRVVVRGLHARERGNRLPTAGL
ncbi:MAG: hypothetical protein AVDCRST_MAG85-2909, partial [uncultured Solirubrobacteraceae bacterium]